MLGTSTNALNNNPAQAVGYKEDRPRDCLPPLSNALLLTETTAESHISSFSLQ